MNFRETKQEERQKIKQYKKQLKSEIFEVENEIDYSNDGSAIIDCKVENLHELFSPYDVAKNRTFCNEFFDYLLDETSIIPIHDNLEIRIHSTSEFSEQDKAKIKKAMKNDFGFYITNDIVRLRRMTTSFIVLISLGILSLFAISLTSSITSSFPLNEFLLIVAWFFLWEGISLGVFDRQKIKTHRYNLLRLYNAKIVFISENKKDL